MNTLAQYLDGLIKRKGEPSHETIKAQTGIGVGTISYIRTGKTEKPDPDTLRRLAMFLGESDFEKAEIYKELMEKAGYLDGFPILSEKEIVYRLRREYPEIYRQIANGNE